MIRRLNITFPDDLDAQLREAASSLGEAEYVRRATAEKIARDDCERQLRHRDTVIEDLERRLAAVERKLRLT